MKYYILLIFTIGMLFTCKQSNAQTNTNNSDSLIEATIILNDGTVLKGTIISMNLDEVTLKTSFTGIIVIKQKNIANITNTKNEVKTQTTGKPNYYEPKPTDEIVKYKIKLSNAEVRHKYWWNNNYQGLKKNELYYQNIGLLYNGLDYGVIDNFTIGGGAFFLGIVGFFNIHLRTQFKITDGISIGATYNHFIAGAATSSRSSSDNSIGLLSGGLTFGNTSKNLTISTGKFTNLVNSDKKDQTDFGLIVCGSIKLSNSMYLLTDNYFSDKRTNINMNCVGFRSVKNNTIFDFGLMVFNNQSGNIDSKPIGIPYLALSVKIQ